MREIRRVVKLNDVNSEVRVYTLADLHLGDGLMDKDRVKKWVEDVLEYPNSIVIVNGDLINNATRNSVSDIFSAVLTPDEQIDALVELLEPIKDKIVLMIEGNHEGRSYRQDGILIIKRVARELGIGKTYSNGAYLLFIELENGLVYSIYGKHGSGGGKRVGSKANRLEDMLDNVNADVFLHSHTHQAMSFRLVGNYIHPDSNEKYEKEHLFVNTNAFLNFGGYGEEKGYRPASTVYPHIKLGIREKVARCLI